VDAEHAGKDGSGEFSGELEQGGGADTVAAHLVLTPPNGGTISALNIPGYYSPSTFQAFLVRQKATKRRHFTHFDGVTI
jgi:hypothetical protein